MFKVSDLYDVPITLQSRGTAESNRKRHWLVEQKLLHFVDAFHQYVMDRVSLSHCICGPYFQGNSVAICNLDLRTWTECDAYISDVLHTPSKSKQSAI